MAFHRRKLLDLSLLCNPYCDAPAKFNGYCPSQCFDFCPPDTCTKQINPTPPPPPPPCPPPPPSTTTDSILNKSTPLSLLLIASLAVLATAFFIFTCYTIYKFYAVWLNSRQRRPPQPRRPDDGGGDSESEEDYGPAVDHPIWYIRTAGLQPSVINAIAVVKYKKSDGLVDGTDCAVCLSEFQEDETVRLLPKCSHAFHIPCIDTWLASHTNCPMCRAGIVSAAALSPPAGDSGRAEEAQLEASAEARIEIEDENIHKMDAVQPVRRSVSMDSISASMISAAVANALSESNKQLEKGKERRSVGVNGTSMERGGSSSIKRSASCSAKVFLSRHYSRNGR